jgi:hypothetical protein
MAKSDKFPYKQELHVASVRARGYDKLTPSPYAIDDPLLMDKLAAEGHKLLESQGERAPKVPGKTLETALGEKSKNPYIRARIKVLGDMPLSRRERILKMEQDNTAEHSFEYKDFVAMVRKLGDELSNKPLDK